MKPDSQKQALIVIDVQNDFCCGGALPVSSDDAFLDKINVLIRKYNCVILTQDWHPANHISFAASHNISAISAPLTQPGAAAKHNANADTASKPKSINTDYGIQQLWPVHCVAGSKGAAFHPKLITDTAALIIRKGYNADCDSYSAFCDARGQATGLGGFLRERNIEKLTFCGLATDFCVAYSVLDAAKQGFETRVALAAAHALDIDGSYDRALNAMRQSGTELGLFG